MLAQTYVRFPSPITLDLRIATGEKGHKLEPFEFTELPLQLRLDAVARTISASLSPIPGEFLLYGPEDFIAACPDTPEEFAERVLQVLGEDPASSLQGLINGEPPALPPRIPRLIANWRAKAVLGAMGKLDAVATIIGTLPEAQRVIVETAWNGDAGLSRKGATVNALGAALGMSEADIDQLFIQADAIQL